jgi:hypothetical protein
MTHSSRKTSVVFFSQQSLHHLAPRPPAPPPLQFGLKLREQAQEPKAVIPNALL